jgi:hypothetical protein
MDPASAEKCIFRRASAHAGKMILMKIIGIATAFTSLRMARKAVKSYGL